MRHQQSSINTVICFLLCFAMCSSVKEKGLELINKSNTETVSCQTTKGTFELEVYPEWAPLGAKHFLELVSTGFYQDIALYRCVDGFLTQFGISDKPKYKHWHNRQIEDDPNLNLGIRKYYLSFAGGGPNTRNTQLFIANENLSSLGKSPWETPFGRVVKGHNVIDSWYRGYGEISAFSKNGPDQQMIYRKGNKYLRKYFPNLDYIVKCELRSQAEL